MNPVCSISVPLHEQMLVSASQRLKPESKLLGGRFQGALTTVVQGLAGEAVQGGEDAPAEAAAMHCPGSVSQGTAGPAEAGAGPVSGQFGVLHPRPPALSRPSPRVQHPPAPLVMLTVAAGEVCGAHAEAAQHAGASIPAAARPGDRTCG